MLPKEQGVTFYPGFLVAFHGQRRKTWESASGMDIWLPQGSSTKGLGCWSVLSTVTEGRLGHGTIFGQLPGWWEATHEGMGRASRLHGPGMFSGELEPFKPQL